MACAPGWRRSRWWRTGSAHAAAVHGSPCGSASAVSGGPPLGAAERPTHPLVHKHHRDSCGCRRTSFHRPRPRSLVDATGTCTSQGHQILQEMRRDTALQNQRGLGEKHASAVMVQEELSLFCTWAAGVFPLSFILTATTSLITQILEIHLHLLTGLLD